MNRRSFEVAIIGAGLAGLTAAFRLFQKGIDVQVYEGRKRVGGRIFSVGVAGEIGELGALNIGDGGEAECIRKLAKELGVPLTTTHLRHDLRYRINGEFHSSEKIFSQISWTPEELKDKLEEAAQTSGSMQDLLQKLFPPESDIYKTAKVRLEAYEGGALNRLSSYYWRTLYHMLLGGLSSVHAKKSSDEYLLEFVSCKHGNASLTEGLRNKLGGRIHFGKMLTAMDKDSAGGSVLTFAEGEKVSANAVVMAIPGSLYQSIEFSPQVLSPERKKKISSVELGSNSKIMTPLTRPEFHDPLLSNDSIIAFQLPQQRILNFYCNGSISNFSADTIGDVYKHGRDLVNGWYQAFPETPPQLAAEEALAHFSDQLDTVGLRILLLRVVTPTLELIRTRC